MDKLMVLDGDFEAQLCYHYNETGEEDSAFALRALKFNKFAVYLTHLDFLRAGAQIIRTNTNLASVNTFQTQLNINLDIASLLGSAVKLARQAVCKYYEETYGDSSNVQQYKLRRPLVAGSCGSYSTAHFNVPSFSSGEPTINEMFLFHDQRVKVLMEAGVDLLAFESIPTWNEMVVIMKILKKYPNARAWITFLCSQEGRLSDNTKFTTLTKLHYEYFRQEQIIAIGARCDKQDWIRPMIRDFNDARNEKVPFVLYINKNDLYNTDIGESSNLLPQQHTVQQCLDVGVRYIGGGPGTVAKDIAEIRRQVNVYRNYEGRNFITLNAISYKINENQSKL